MLLQQFFNEDKTFEVTAWNLADWQEKIQFSLYAIDQPLIDFPTAFSPNGDGLNDYTLYELVIGQKK